MKKLIYLIVVSLILGLLLTGCSLLSNIGQAPATDQIGITYLTKEIAYSDLVALWHFSGNALDSSGNNNNGTVEAGATYVDNLTMGQALSFDGTNGYVRVDHHAELNPTSAITVECWAKLDSVNPGPVLVRKLDTYSLQVTNLGGESKLEGWVKIGGLWQGVRSVSGGVTIQTDTLYHFAFTYDGAELKTYVNWQLDRYASVTGSIDFTTKPLDIGRCGPEDSSGVGWYANGIIDEVRIWNVALPKEELGKFYDWTGFFRPVEDLPTYNAAKAGRAIPVKFSLNGDQGLDIFEDGYPISVEIDCDNSTVLEAAIIEGTDTADGSSLNYDAYADQYIYVWKTVKDWAGTCRKLVVLLNDGTSHEANFTFK